MHDPHNVDDAEGSVHLTIAIGEHTPYWAAEEMIKDAIHDVSAAHHRSRRDDRTRTA